jgi:hypothetical protein
MGVMIVPILLRVTAEDMRFDSCNGFSGNKEDGTRVAEQTEPAVLDSPQGVDRTAAGSGTLPSR